MSGRMGTAVEAVFGQNAIPSILSAIDEGAKSGGLSGRIEADAKGEYRAVECAGSPDVGMFFVSEGTDPGEEMVEAVRKVLGEGVILVVDPDICEMAVYRAGPDGVVPATALMSERRSDPYRVAIAHILFGYALSRHDVGDYPVEQQQDGILEHSSQRRYGADLGSVRDIHHYGSVGDLGQRGSGCACDAEHG